MINKIIAIIFTLFGLFGCVSKAPLNQTSSKNIEPIEVRIAQAKQLTHWKITGKIAFIQPDKKESATLFWQVDQKKQTQTLKLTTYLGINLLSLSSKNSLHTLNVDGETYQNENLAELLQTLTGLQLPTQALHYWLKGLRFSDEDSIIYEQNSNLPKTLSSQINQQPWTISFSKYKKVNDVFLAHRFSLTNTAVTIKISVNKWNAF